MKWFYTRKEIDQLSALELKALHRSMIRVVFALLTLSAIVSILAIWAFIPHYFQYIVLIVGVVLWPWIRNLGYMARKMT